ncbi:cytochrome P460 family protein [Rhizobium sp. NPDC090279]|uniref:cytochrome P460 family protein n=1 Tax=Rhizobium sp. NPDC090279 TaxID=3364499 RepID=UPI00383A7FDD
MKSFLSRTVLAAVIICAVTILAFQVEAETNRVRFPDNLDNLVHYTGRERGNSVTHIKTTQSVIDLIKAGKPIPNGSQFVLIDYRDGKLYRYFVMEKGANWGTDYDESRRTGDWQFQWFWADRSVNMAENTNRCQSCHQGASDSDFLFTHGEIQAFNGMPVN